MQISVILFNSIISYHLRTYIALVGMVGIYCCYSAFVTKDYFLMMFHWMECFQFIYNHTLINTFPKLCPRFIFDSFPGFMMQFELTN